MKIYKIFTAAIAALLISSCSVKSHDDSRLVILHTNDTHSQIEPGSDGLGGVMRRKFVVDSIRQAEKNVMLLDAGDAVQGTLYFYLYGGKVEQEIMNFFDVDACILGNHEFDNGIDSLAAVLKLSDTPKISTNYNLDNTPLKDLFVPYLVKEYGGKKVGIIGLNLDPKGMISEGNYNGLEYLDAIECANKAAAGLRKDNNADVVIALTHLGYNIKGVANDSLLAVNSRGIDLIIGGHSHEMIDTSLKNLDGADVRIFQVGKAGRNIGKIELNLNDIGDIKSEVIQIDNSYDFYNDSILDTYLEPYRAGIDSLMIIPVGYSSKELSNKDIELLNYFSDFIFETGGKYAPGIELSIANKGGLRTTFPEGAVSKGQIINMVPFRNYLTVLDIKGADLEDVFDVMARTDGNGVSRNVAVVYKNGDEAKAEEIYINGNKLDKDKIYRVATIDYLANGGDYMTGLTKGTVVAKSLTPIYEELSTYIINNDKPIGGDNKNRWTKQ